MIVLLAPADTTANRTNGALMPNPNEMKFSMFTKKLVTVSVLTNNAAMNKGLHGITIAPKNSPKRKDLNHGFSEPGVLILGAYFPISISKMSNRLINVNIMKAIGEITPIALVSED